MKIEHRVFLFRGSSTPVEFAEIIRTEIPKWGKVLKDANVAPE